MNAQFSTPGGRELARRIMGPARALELEAAQRQARIMAAVEAAAGLSRICGRELAPLEESDQ